ncbi:MAG: hypothetical protein JW997_00410 [Actinobacteria bacterium]|nr:hypothetical protein [Actinomycetota bacterium]
MFNKKSIYLVNILIFCLVVAVIAGCQVISKEEDVYSEIETVEPVATTDISGIKTVSLENETIVGDITWKIIDLNVIGPEIVGTDNYTFKAVRGKFVNIEFMIKNDSDDVRTLYDLKVIDSKGRVYSLCLPAYAFFSTREKACTLVDVIPDSEYTFEAPFDISPDSEGLILEVTDLKIPVEDKVYIDLGY